MFFRRLFRISSSLLFALVNCSAPSNFFSEQPDGGSGETSRGMAGAANGGASGRAVESNTGGQKTAPTTAESAAGDGAHDGLAGASGGASTQGQGGTDASAVTAGAGQGGTDFQSTDGGEGETASTASWPLLNGVEWADTQGNPIQAHGGSVLAVGRYYYWFGERRNTQGTFAAIAAYRSLDLVRWEFVNDVLRDTSDPTLHGAMIRQPQVVLNVATGKYVMWMHWENGSDSGQARAAVAISGSVAGDYAYQGSFRPFAESGVMDHSLPGYMSRDCSLFVDDDQTGYFLSASNDDADLNLYQLSSDYSKVERRLAVLFAGQHRTAPVLFKRNSIYFLLSAGGANWSPNQTRYAASDALASGWSGMSDIGDATSFYSRPSFVLSIQHGGKSSYLYMGDRWALAWGGSAADSTYVWQPIAFPADRGMSMSWGNTLLIDASSASISATTHSFQIINVKSGAAMEVSGTSLVRGAGIVQNPQTSAPNQIWDLNYNGSGYFRVTNVQSKKLLDVSDELLGDGAKLQLWDDHNGDNQLWLIVDLGAGKFKLKNKLSGKFLSVAGASTANGAALEQRQSVSGEEQQWRFVPTP